MDDVQCDALICDPPYGARTHNGQSSQREGIAFASWAPEDVSFFVHQWAQRTRGWMVCLTSHDRIPHYTEAYEAEGRYAFAPVPCIVRGMTCRHTGDGPSSWAVYALVSRPRKAPWSKWGTLDGAYSVARGDRRYLGGKPLALMRALVRDYSREGDLVCDPCGGHATTLAAAFIEGRRSVGCEVEWSPFLAGRDRLDHLVQSHGLPANTHAPTGTQVRLF